MYAQLSNSNLKIPFIDAYVQVMIFIKEQFRFSSLMVGILLFFGQLQPLYPILEIHLDEQQSSIIQPIFYLLRPELTILQISYIDSQYYYLIPFIIIIFKNLSQMVIVCLFMTKVRNFQQLEGQFNVQLLVRLLGIYQQYLCQTFIIPLTTMCLYTIKIIFENDQNNEKAIHILFAVITLLLLQVDGSIYLMVTEKSITYRIMGIEKIKITFWDFIIYSFKLLQMIIFLGFSKSELIIHLQHIIFILISIMMLENQYKHRGYLLNYQIYITFFTSTLQLVIGLISYLGIYINNQQWLITGSSLLFPLSFFIMININYKEQIRSYYYLYRPSNLLINELVYQLIRLLNISESDSSSRAFQINLIYQVCSKLPNTTVSDLYNISEPFQANPLTKNMEKNFVFSLLQIIKQNYKSYRIKSFYQKQYLLYSYLILLYSFGWYQLSVKNLSFLIYRHRKNCNKKDDYLYQMTSHNSSYENQDKSLILIEENDYSQIKLTLYQRNKFIFLLKKSKLHMKNKFGSSLMASQQNQMTTYINYYLLNEFKLNQSYCSIIDQIQGKIDYYQKLMYYFDYEKLKSLSQSINNLEEELKRYYQECPSLRFQKMLCFYQAEVLNNYYVAYKYQKSLADENLFGFDSIDQLGYAFISVNEDLNNLNVEQYSIKFAEIYGRDTNAEKLKFSQILPKIFINEHNNMIETFLNTGKSSYYRSFSNNFMRTTNGLIKCVSTCFDNTALISQDKLLFVALTQEDKNLTKFFLVDSSYRTGGFSKEFFEKLGYEEKFIKEFMDNFEIDDIGIELIIPNFEALVSEGYMEKKIVNEEMYFIDLWRVRRSDQKKRNSRVITDEDFKNEKNIEPFICDMTIKMKIINRFLYYLVEFENIYKQKQVTNQSYVVNVQNEELEPQSVHVFEIKNRVKYHIEETRNINISHNYISIDGSPQFQMTSRNGSMQLLRQSSQKLSVSVLQQEFFNSQADELNSNYNQAEIDDLMHFHQKVIKSAYSTGSLRASALFNKAVLIQRVLEFRPPSRLSSLLLYLIFAKIVMLIFSILILDILPQDLLAFIEEIDMIALHSGIMAPHDLFFSMRFTINQYETYFEEGLINEDQCHNLTDPYYEHLPFAYQAFKQSLYDELQNYYIRKFINDENMTLTFMDSNTSSLYEMNMSVREMIILQTQVQYQILDMYIKRISVLQSAPLVFDYANYVQTHQQLDHITSHLKQYSIDRSEVVKNKWLTITIIFLLMQFTISIVLYFRFDSYLSDYDKFLGLYSFVNIHQLIVEQERYKKIMKEVQKDLTYIYKYYFDTDRKEFQPDNINNNSLVKSSGKYKINIKNYSRIPIIILLSTLFLLYSAFLLTVQQTSLQYFNKYEATTDFYKLLQDMKLRSGAIMVYKELLLRQDMYDFWQEGDRQYLLQMIQKSEDIISVFIALTATLDSTKYLVDDSFLNFFNQIQEPNNLCLFIEYEFFDFMDYYCQKAFANTLLKGIVQSLNYLVNQIKTEQALNNFTERASSELYMFEGSQIITRVFFNLSATFQTGLNHITHSRAQLAKVLAILYIVYIIIFGLIFIIGIKSYLTTEYQVVKRIVSLVPMQLILTEEIFERYLKQIAHTQKLL